MGTAQTRRAGSFISKVADTRRATCARVSGRKQRSRVPTVLTNDISPSNDSTPETVKRNLVELFKELPEPVKVLLQALAEGNHLQNRTQRQPADTDYRGPVVTSITQRNTRLESGEIDELATRYIEGENVAGLAERFGIHPSTVRNHLKRQSIPLRPRGLDPSQSGQASALYKQGLSLADIGQQFGFSPKAVRGAVTNAGGTIRSRGRRS